MGLGTDVAYQIPVIYVDTDASGDLDTLSVFEWTAALGIASTERLGFFIELFGEIALNSDGSSAELIDIERSFERRSLHGGTARDTVAAALTDAEARLGNERQRLEQEA